MKIDPKIEKQLRRFCADRTRAPLDMVQHTDNLVWATNGHIAAWTHTEECAPSAEDQQVPDFARYVADIGPLDMPILTRYEADLFRRAVRMVRAIGAEHTTVIAGPMLEMYGFAPCKYVGEDANLDEARVNTHIPVPEDLAGRIKVSSEYLKNVFSLLRKSVFGVKVVGFNGLTALVFRSKKWNVLVIGIEDDKKVEK